MECKYVSIQIVTSNSSDCIDSWLFISLKLLLSHFWLNYRTRISFQSNESTWNSWWVTSYWLSRWEHTMSSKHFILQSCAIIESTKCCAARPSVYHQYQLRWLMNTLYIHCSQDRLWVPWLPSTYIRSVYLCMIPGIHQSVGKLERFYIFPILNGIRYNDTFFH